MTADDVRAWLVYLLDHYSDSYANNQFRALQQVFKWFAEEEEVGNPMGRLKPPKVAEKIVPVFTERIGDGGLVVRVVRLEQVAGLVGAEPPVHLVGAVVSAAAGPPVAARTWMG
ncbi:hypothetical protein Ga0074812_12735 [Parafrankia irregularis]|uniref:Phage integrase, N-terminal SAM-like domain n=1 Tax=Parafrankia irregularis TaxID=795642 RepID=A0A0S4QWA7_9ACTN|nr:MULTISPECIES: hypothetical protein [Parafrankia]MBE3201567.1 hypothetical protein [Parafrankia sp. CH37]CUU59358.1 hypothetical protein Ga0074812_12735 [Parafrankia irregularis]